MNIRKAIEIFENLSSNQYTDEEKVIAIYEVMNMPTHMSIKKETILNALKWLWHSAYEVETEEKETVGAEQTCEECLHYEVCLLGACVNGKTGTCLKFKDKSRIVEPLDNAIIFVKDKWLMLNMESKDLGEAIKRIIDYASKDAMRGEDK